jgi:hypothetical protein
MDDPASSMSYNVQLLQDDGGGAPGLREVVHKMQNTGLSPNILKCMTGIPMMQIRAKAE